MEIQINEKTHHCPDSWNELSLHMLYKLYLLFFMHLERILPAEEITWATRITAARMLLEIDDDFLRQWRELRIQEHGEEIGLDIFTQELRSICSAATAFMFDTKTDEDTGAETTTIQYGLTRNPYPTLHAFPAQEWFGPADALANITLYELGMLFTQWEQYVSTQDDSHAHTLIAIMYRPSKPWSVENDLSNYHGDRRLPLMHYESTIPDRAEGVKLLPPVVIQLLLFYFISSRQAIVQAYPKVFKESGAGDGADSYGWGGLLLSIAENPAHVETIAGQHYSNSLTYLSMLEDQRRAQELQRLRR